MTEQTMLLTKDRVIGLVNGFSFESDCDPDEIWTNIKSVLADDDMLLQVIDYILSDDRMQSIITLTEAS